MAMDEGFGSFALRMMVGLPGQQRAARQTWEGEAVRRTFLPQLPHFTLSSPSSILLAGLDLFRCLFFLLLP